MALKLKQALIIHNERSGEKMTQEQFGQLYYGDRWYDGMKGQVSGLFNGKVKKVDVAKAATILGVSSDYLLGLSECPDPANCWPE